ncbi:hypothetical protein C8Q80DRAFT_1348613 [Daedaleopsis nitida]|nr:hypothetical protein C8Q80DRAFT_1348613 [Daedaleopsis nitida]
MSVHSEHYPDGLSLNSQNPFPNLRNIAIKSDVVKWCISFIDQVQSPYISMLQVSSAEVVTATSHARLFTILSLHPSSNVTTSLTLSFAQSTDPSWEPLLPDVFSILFVLRHLERITLSASCYAALDDATLAAMAGAWSKLRSAEIYPKSLDGVWGPRECPLYTLGVGLATIAEVDVIPTAAILSQWFPYLDWVEYYSEFTAEEEEAGVASDGSPTVRVVELRLRWGCVSRLVRSFAVVRAQEQLSRLATWNLSSSQR